MLMLVAVSVLVLHVSIAGVALWVTGCTGRRVLLIVGVEPYFILRVSTSM
jgi:hypothetical protein